MLLGVISDTHGHTANCLAAVARLEEERVDVVIHCGDIGSQAIVPLFAQWPTHFVFGNVDGNRLALKTAIEKLGQTCHGEFGSLALAGKQIAFLHGDDSRRLRETVTGGAWHLVCSGHTHRASLEQLGGTVVLNPGAVYRATPHSVAVVDLNDLAVKFLKF